MSNRLKQCINVADFRNLARQRLPKPVMDFLDGGAEDEWTLRRNHAAFSEWSLLPRSMCDLTDINAKTRVMGVEVDWPFIVGPTGLPGLIHPDGEVGIALAAERSGTLYSLSTMASQSIEHVAAATRGPKAFQLYIFRDRAISLELLQRAQASGYEALILTVDVQVPANRERDRRSGMLIPPRFTPKSMVHFAFSPRWCWNTLVRRPVRLANFDGRRADPGVPLLTFINEQFDPALSWRDLEWVRMNWKGPLAIKGILSPDDAELAFEHGADTVILSNHGGRQLDTAVSPLDMLPKVIDRLAGRSEIILDGGIRRGTDILKAMALGARATMGGRIGLYGLGAGGGEGATAVIATLRAEFERDMALLGVKTIAEIDRSRIQSIFSSSPFQFDLPMEEN